VVPAVQFEQPPEPLGETFVGKYDYAFDPDEPNNTAASIYALARSGGDRILDIGSGPALVARYLSANDEKSVTCVDYDQEALDEAAEAGVADTVLADLEAADWEQPLVGKRFDTVVLADVLEHLRDPGALLSTLLQQQLLAEDGQLVVSVPNAGHESVVAELLAGKFRYTRTGILDDTHIRWFTLDSLSMLLESRGFIVTEVRRTLRTLEQTQQRGRGPALGPAAVEAIADLGIEGRTYQYVLRARPRTVSGQLAHLREEIDQLEDKLADAVAWRSVAERRLTETQVLLGESRARVRELEAAQTRYGELDQRRHTAERRLRAIQASSTYRLSRVLAGTLHPIRSYEAARRRLDRGTDAEA
jgi:predicted TPR repeat methyltransferase